MPTLVLRGRYLILDKLEKFLKELFPEENFSITQRRGQYVVNIPRPLTPEEEVSLEEAITEDY